MNGLTTYQDSARRETFTSGANKKKTKPKKKKYKSKKKIKKGANIRSSW